MTKKKIDIRDYAGEIIKAMRPGILLTTKVGDKVNSMTIGWGTIGIIWERPVFVESQSGDILSVIVAIGGLDAAGYHIPMYRTGKSKVCDNRFSCAIMVILSVSCLCLLTSLFF